MLRPIIHVELFDILFQCTFFCRFILTFLDILKIIFPKPVLIMIIKIKTELYSAQMKLVVKLLLRF